MSIHNICFHAEIRKILCGYPSYLELCSDLHVHVHVNVLLFSRLCPILSSSSSKQTYLQIPYHMSS